MGSVAGVMQEETVTSVCPVIIYHFNCDVGVARSGLLYNLEGVLEFGSCLSMAGHSEQTHEKQWQ